MKRREVLKGLTIAAGGAVWPNKVWSMLTPGQNAGGFPLVAVPIRGLVKKDGRQAQPVQIAVQHCGADAAAVTKLNGVEVDRRILSAGPNTYQVSTEPVSVPQDVTVTVAIGDSATSAVVKLKPVRKVLVYMLPHSHHDLGYTDIQAHIEEKQMHNLTLAIDLARKTSDYPEGARLIWNAEVLWGVDLYMRRKSQREKDELIDAIKKGWVSLNCMYGNQLTGLSRPEELMQSFRFGTQLGDQFGVRVDSAMLSDVPGYTWGTITAMSQAGVRYFSAAPNNGDRIGRIKIVWHDMPFWHLSPTGKEKVLVWMPGHGYSSWGSANADMAADCQDYLDSVSFPYDISYMRWSGHGDNALPDPQICEFVKLWNQNYEWPKFAISSTSEAFSAFEKRYGSEIPQFKGDLTPYWEDGAGSSALETAINRNSSDRVAQAEAIMAMSAAGAYRLADFTEAWRNILLYTEHTWGAGGSVQTPDAPTVTEQWAVKRQFALDGETQSRQLLAQALRSYGAGIPTSTSAIDVVNATSWPRTEVILLSKELSSAGDHVKDEHGRSLPSQRLSTGELAFLAREVPAFGSARFHLLAEKPHAPAIRVSVKDGVLENGILRVRVDGKTGNLVELTLHGKPANLIDTSCGGAVNEYLFVEGKDFKEVWKAQNEAEGLHYQDFAFDGPDVGRIQKSGPVHITVEEDGPLVSVLRIESSAPGCNSLVRRVRLAAGADWLELSNTVDKRPSPRNPYPDNINAPRAWSMYGGKESLQFAFPFAVPDGKMHMDIPLAEMLPEIDQLPGSNKNWLPVGRWIDIANVGQGVTWVTLDAPLVEIGKISATLAGPQHNPLLWRNSISPTQKFYSWVMNNHWETNYCASQEGVVEFRYALRAHDGYDPAAASRLAIGLSQPLVACAARADAPAEPLLQVEPADVLALTLKPSDDGNAWIVRLFGASGEDRTAKLHWSTPAPPRLWLSDLSEKPIHPLEPEIPVAGWGLVTVRADR
jgi:alpha-mannosidase